MPTANVFAFGLASSLKIVQNLMLLKEHDFHGFALLMLKHLYTVCVGVINNLWLCVTSQRNLPGTAEMDFPVNETAHLLRDARPDCCAICVDSSDLGYFISEPAEWQYLI